MNRLKLSLLVGFCRCRCESKTVRKKLITDPKLGSRARFKLKPNNRRVYGKHLISTWREGLSPLFGDLPTAVGTLWSPLKYKCYATLVCFFLVWPKTYRVVKRLLNFPLTTQKIRYIVPKKWIWCPYLLTTSLEADLIKLWAVDF